MVVGAAVAVGSASDVVFASAVAVDVVVVVVVVVVPAVAVALVAAVVVASASDYVSMYGVVVAADVAGANVGWLKIRISLAFRRR